MSKTYESFRWAEPLDQFKSMQGNAPKTLLIKAKLLTAGISLNHRQYLADEITKAGRTLAGRDINVNHDKNRIIGHVKGSEPEDDWLEAILEITDPIYVAKMRDFFIYRNGKLSEKEFREKHGVIPRGWSIEGIYRKNSPKWGIDTPIGLFLEGLALVEDPEVPGIESEFNLIETVQGITRILNEMMENKEEYKLEKAKNFVTTSEPSVTLESIKKGLKEQEEEEEKPVEEPCPEGQRRDPMTGECVPIEEKLDEETCPEGMRKDPETGECVPVEEEPAKEVVTPKLKAPSLNVPKVEVKPLPPHAVEVEQIKDFPTVQLPKMLKLGEPFADYTDFADCVSKNTGKVDDPEAYCAVVKRKVEGETFKPEIAETFPYFAKQDTQNFIRDVMLAENQNKINVALGVLSENLKAIPSYLNTLKTELATQSKLAVDREGKQISEVNSSFASQRELNEKWAKDLTLAIESFGKSTVEQFNMKVNSLSKVPSELATMKKTLTSLVTELNTVKTTLAELSSLSKMPSELTTVKETLSTDMKTEVNQLKETIRELREENNVHNEKLKKFDEYTQAMEAWREKYKSDADKTIGQRDEKLEKLEVRNQELENKVKELEGKLEETKITVENVDERTKKGQFKGQNPKLNTGGDISKRPEDVLRDTKGGK